MTLHPGRIVDLAVNVYQSSNQRDESAASVIVKAIDCSDNRAS
jgi:hypothetical protein